MSGEPFVDTNIWVYAHLETPQDPKGDLARALVESDHRFVVSTQVLNEYYAAMLKNRIPDLAIQNNLEAMIQHCDVVLVSVPVIRQAHVLKNRYGFSLWDSLVVSSALDAGCPVLYSEDLQHDQRIEGRLVVRNPFRARSD
jgi:predicted nucleic acid-binding protein